MTDNSTSSTFQPAPFTLAGRTFQSRLLLGTGKYKDAATMTAALEASGTEIVTVALRRVNLDELGKGSLIDQIDPKRYLLLPNTAGCYTADEAIRTARLARELGGWEWVKLEVIGDKQTLFPDTAETLRAAEVLLKEGFIVLPYTNDDPIVCRKLADLGCPAVMPLAAPIGSGMGIRNRANLAIILEQATTPIIVDAGVGTASDAALAMELGRRRGAHEHGGRRGEGSGRDGPGDAPGDRSRLPRPPRRQDSAPPLRQRLVAGRRADRVVPRAPPGVALRGLPEGAQTRSVAAGSPDSLESSLHAAVRAAIAQLDRAPDYESDGWRFDSSWLHHFSPTLVTATPRKPSPTRSRIPFHRCSHSSAG